MSFLVSLLYHRSEEEGSEETMDTESQQRSTLSNEVYKQVLKSARKQVFYKLPIVDIAVSATWQFIMAVKDQTLLTRNQSFLH